MLRPNTNTRSQGVCIDDELEAVITINYSWDANLEEWVPTPSVASGGLTDAELRATPVAVTGDFASDGLTDAELRATPVVVSIDGGMTTDGLTDAELRAEPVPVSGTITANLGTIDGAATETTLASILTELGQKYEGGAIALDGATLTALETTELGATSLAALEAITATISGTVPVSGPLTDAQLRAVAVPVSLASVPTHGVTGTFWQATQPVSLASVPSHAVTGPLTDAQLRATAVPIVLDAAALAALETTELGATTLAALETIQVGSLPAIPAGTNNIGDVDVLTVPAPLNLVGGGTEAAALRVTLANNSTGVVSLSAATLAALETIGLDATTLAALETIQVGNFPATQPVSVAATVTTRESQPQTADFSSVAASITSVVLKAANTSRRVLTIYNDSVSILYLRFGADASSTAFVVKMQPDGYYEVPSPVYTGAIYGIWVTATGSARVTEIT